MTGDNGNGNGRIPGPGDIVVSSRAIELDRQARALGLTEIQQRFALHFLADPGNGYTAAAAKVGSRNPKRIGHRWANMPKVLEYMKAVREAAGDAPIVPPPEVPIPPHKQLPNMALTPEVVTAPYSPAAYEIDVLIADRHEVMKGVTALRRAKLGHFLDKEGHVILARVRRAAPGVVKRYREKIAKLTRNVTTEPGSTVVTAVEEMIIDREIELVDGLGATALLGKFLGMEKGDGAPKPVINLKRFLRALPDEVLKPMATAARTEMERRG